MKTTIIAITVAVALFIISALSFFLGGCFVANQIHKELKLEVIKFDKESDTIYLSPQSGNIFEINDFEGNSTAYGKDGKRQFIIIHKAK